MEIKHGLQGKYFANINSSLGFSLSAHDARRQTSLKVLAQNTLWINRIPSSPLSEYLCHLYLIAQRLYLGWVILVSAWLGHWGPRYLLRHDLGVCVRLFLAEVNAWACRLISAGFPFSCDEPHPVIRRVNKTERVTTVPWGRGNSSPLTAITWDTGSFLPLDWNRN